MSLRLLLPALGVGLALTCLVGAPSPAAEKADPERIAKLVEQLGSNNFSEREEATRALDAIGAPALDALKKAAEDSDIEVRRRAEQLVQKIAKRAEMENLLAPKRLRLTYKDTPVEQAVADFARRSGYNIVLAGDRSKLAERTVTLDTGETTFWEAFDQFCAAAKLMENGQGGRITPPPLRGGPIRIRPLQINKAAPAIAPAAAAVAVAEAPAAATGALRPTPLPLPFRPANRSLRLSAP